MYYNPFPQANDYNGHNLQIPFQMPCPIQSPPGVIGEGEVKSVLLPNGNYQYFFIPTTPASNYPCHMNTCCHNKTGQATWYYVANPPPPPMQVDSSPTFNVKFHNDAFTSTTDIHYFIPKQKKSCECVIRHTVGPGHRTCCRHRVHKDSSHMLVDESPPPIQRKNCKCFAKPETKEKSIITYNDKACSSSASNSCQTNRTILHCECRSSTKIKSYSYTDDDS